MLLRLCLYATSVAPLLNSIGKPCLQVPDSGFKLQDLAIARISLIHRTARYKNNGNLRYLQCFLLGYEMLSTLQDTPGALQKLSGWILGGDHTDIYIYICMHILIYIYIYGVPCRRVNSPPPGRPSWSQQADGDSTAWVLLTSSSFRLQVDPTWWLQGDLNGHAPSIGALAPLPPFLLPSGRVLQGLGGLNMAMLEDLGGL